MIALVRHGAYSIKTGSLTEEGQQQAHQAAQELKTSGAWKRIIASTSTRTQETGDIISRDLHIPLTLDDRWAKDNTADFFRSIMEPDTIYVTHAPILHAILPDWDANIGSVKILP